ncbi:hypothetical protein HYFRA_00011985 [Hymenoscyphus fraxineus]|uniref:Uncharacterized protein n=1 Tax=Hymenoscyphus fraxineus TaxID=746836 RepID=A0A9N9KYT1_9HELO|nr:hypothetical protein HYFRA_00011985 [Hymenoscyphus fraxineus]
MPVPRGARQISESDVENPAAQISEEGISESAIGLKENKTGDGRRKEEGEKKKDNNGTRKLNLRQVVNQVLHRKEKEDGGAVSDSVVNDEKENPNVQKFVNSSRKICFSEHKLRISEKKTVDITTLPSSENKTIFLDLDPDGICESPTELQPGERIGGRPSTVKCTDDQMESAEEEPKDVAAIVTSITKISKEDIKFVNLQPRGPGSAGSSIKPKSRERNEGCKSMVGQFRNIGKENDYDRGINEGTDKANMGTDVAGVGKAKNKVEERT